MQVQRKWIISGSIGSSIGMQEALGTQVEEEVSVQSYSLRSERSEAFVAFERPRALLAAEQHLGGHLGESP